jgi:hypothetical protein
MGQSGFSVTDIHYVVPNMGASTPRVTGIRFRMSANTSTSSVTAWFDSAVVPAEKTYTCSSSGHSWSCTGPDDAAAESVQAAKSLYVEVDGHIQNTGTSGGDTTKVLGTHVARPQNGRASSGGQAVSVLGTTLPFTGARLDRLIASAVLALTMGAVLIVLSRRRRQSMTD